MKRIHQKEGEGGRRGKEEAKAPQGPISPKKGDEQEGEWETSERGGGGGRSLFECKISLHHFAEEKSREKVRVRIRVRRIGLQLLCSDHRGKAHRQTRS